MPRKTILAGNWKMNHSPDEAKQYFLELAKQNLTTPTSASLRVIFPVAYCLTSELQLLASQSQISLGAQNIHWENSGAFTGELSGKHLQSMSISWVLIGHSERRQFFGETDESSMKRAVRAIELGLNFIFCLGENLAEREQGKTFDVLKRQTSFFIQAIQKVKTTAIASIAYEPVWAIGTGKTASELQAQEAHQFIRNELHNYLGSELAQSTSILYGGSANLQNAQNLLNQPDVDGLLIGGASLKPLDFSGILKLAN